MHDQMVPLLSSQLVLLYERPAGMIHAIETVGFQIIETVSSFFLRLYWFHSDGHNTTPNTNYNDPHVDETNPKRHSLRLTWL